MKQLFKKGFVQELGMLPTVMILLLVAVLVASLGQQLLGESRDDVGEDWCTANSFVWNDTDLKCWNSSTAPSQVETINDYSYNATVDAQDGIDNITSKFDTIGLTVAIVLVLSIIVGVFAYIKMR